MINQVTYKSYFIVILVDNALIEKQDEIEKLPREKEGEL